MPAKVPAGGNSTIADTLFWRMVSVHKSQRTGRVSCETSLVMASAAEGYAAAAEGVTTSEPTTTLLSNADGQAVASAADAMAKLVGQMTKPVRWDLCTETMRQQNVTALVEFPPAGALAGIAKRELRGVPTHAVKSPADLDGLAEL